MKSIKSLFIIFFTLLFLIVKGYSDPLQIPIIVDPEFIFGGTQGKWLESFDEPDAVCFLQNGNLIAGDTRNSRFKIYSFSSKKADISIIGEYGDQPGQFKCELHTILKNNRKIYYELQGIAVNPAGQIYVIDQGNHRIQVFTSSGVVIPDKEISLKGKHFAIADPSKKLYFTSFEAIHFDDSSRLYLTDAGTRKVYRFLPDGKPDPDYMFQLRRKDGEYLLDAPESILQWKNFLLVADENHKEIKIYDLESGHYTGKSFGKGLFEGDVEGLGIESNYLYAVDETAGEIHIFDLSNDQPRLAGTFGTKGKTPGKFLSADGLAISHDGKYLAIADQLNYRIQVFLIDNIKKQLGLVK